MTPEDSSASPFRRPRFCPACGAALNDVKRFCPACGKELPTQPKPAPERTAELAPEPVSAPDPAYAPQTQTLYTPQPEPAPEQPPQPPRKKKKLLWLIPAAAVIVLLAAFLIGKSVFLKPVEETAAAIDAIGFVTIDSGEDVSAAQTRYDALSPAQQKRVENYAVLTQAQESYAGCVQTVEDAAALIDGIGEVTLADEDAVLAARAGYEALSVAMKAHIENLQTLEDAEAALAALHQQERVAGIAELVAQESFDDAIFEAEDFLADYGGTDYDAEVEALLSEAREGRAAQYVAEARELFDTEYPRAALDALELCANDFGDTAAADEAAALSDEIWAYVEDLRPYTGNAVENYIGRGDGRLTVDSDDGSGMFFEDYYLKLEDYYDPDEYKTFYVQGGDSGVIAVPDGDYILKYAVGETWYGVNELFGPDTYFCQCDDVFSFETTSDSRYIYYTNYEVTLYTVADGNLSIDAIGEGQF